MVDTNMGEQLDKQRSNDSIGPTEHTTDAPIRPVMQGDLLIGGIEGGGTKMVCAVGYADGRLVDKRSFPTTDPDTTVVQLGDYFEGTGISALGIGTFGPLDANPQSPHYGHILYTPKLGWTGFDFLGSLKRRLSVPMAFDTDVNAACLGEVVFGSSRGLDAVVYMTVGTGIGIGFYYEGKLLHGMMHPEAGHILMRHQADDSFEGICPLHADCLEGLAAGPAVCARFGVAQASDLAENENFLNLESGYLAQALVTFILTYAPQRIVVGGGVSDHVPRLLPLVRQKVVTLMNGYIRTPEFGDIDNYIVAPSCRGNQGVLGAIALGARALCQHNAHA